MTFWDELSSEPWRFDMLATLRRLERENPGKPRLGDARTTAEEFVTISQDPYLVFPDSNLEGAEKDAAGRVRLKARFLGMFGPQGPLPLTTTAEAYDWLIKRDDAFARFVDIFQRRFLALFFRAWADSRPIAQNDRPNEDRFRAYIGSMIGIGTPALRDADSLPDFAKMQFAGLLAPRVKSASRLRSFLAGLLGVRVEIEEFIGAWLPLDRAEQTRLGAANSRMGEDCMLGASMYSVGDKFRVRAYTRDIEHYREFLPGSPLAAEIRDAIFFNVGDEFDWDIELAIHRGKITPTRLPEYDGSGKISDEARLGGAKLGWTSWLAPNWSKTDETYRKDARFHLTSRLAPQREPGSVN
jgi:type VI secretion system protein ImpH